MSTALKKAPKEAAKEKPTIPQDVPGLEATLAEAKTKLDGLSSWQNVKKYEEQEELIRSIEKHLALARARAVVVVDMKIPSPTRQTVAIDAIDVNGNHRQVDAAADPGVVELSKSLAAIGLRQAIAVRKDGKKFRLIFGGRRVAAATVAGWKDIPADVYPEDLTGEQEEAVRTHENVHRQELNFIQEGTAVAQMMDRLKEAGVADEGERVKRCAEGLGKSPTWVRDRLYLSKLSGDARELVISGRLPLAQAREIAKLADPELRDDLAESVARADDGTGGWSAEKVRAHVNEHLLSLKVVPWKLDVPFANAPACLACPCNTRNDPHLFEHEGNVVEHEAGRCTNPTCFERKKEATEKLIEKGVAAVREVVKKKEFPTFSGAVTAKAPDPVKPSTFKRQCDKHIDPESGKVPAAEPKKPRGSSSSGGYQRTTEEIAKDKLREAMEKWVGPINRELSTMAAKSVWHLVVWEHFVAPLLDSMSRYQNGAAKIAAQGRTAKVLAELLDPDAKTVERLAKGEKIEKPHVWLGNTHPDALAVLVKALKLKADPIPRLEDFMPKPAAAGDKKEETPAKGKAKAKAGKGGKTNPDDPEDAGDGGDGDPEDDE